MTLKVGDRVSHINYDKSEGVIVYKQPDMKKDMRIYDVHWYNDVPKNRGCYAESEIKLNN